MSFDPATLLTTAFLTLLLIGTVLATVVKCSRQNAAGLWWIASFLLGALGFLLLVVVRTDPESATQVLANTAFLAAYGCCHSGARSLAGRRPSYLAVAAAVVVWPVIIGVLNPAFHARVLIASTIIAVYSIAAAREFAQGATNEERYRFIAAGLCAAHALFYLVRAVAGPTLGFANASGETVVSSWGAVIALEIVLFAAALATLVVGIMTERVGVEERRAAFTDFLTGIGNRRAFETTIRGVVAAADDHVRAVLLLLDLDNFKEVNDRLGHEAGDQVLKAFVRVIRDQLGDPSMFWRLGGDEFAILLPRTGDHEAEAAAEALRQAVNNSAAVRATLAGVTVSIGSAAVISGEAVADLVRRADTALYGEKNNRRAVNLVPTRLRR